MKDLGAAVDAVEEIPLPEYIKRFLIERDVLQSRPRSDGVGQLAQRLMGRDIVFIPTGMEDQGSCREEDYDGPKSWRSHIL